MSQGRIARRFADLAREGRTGLVAFISAGDPDLATCAEILARLPAAGADIVELGMPFSDPMADGPAVQAAGLRALKAGQTMAKTLGLVRDFRKRDDGTPIVLMGYFNPILQYGVERFCGDAKAAGVDGLIIVDLPPEEAEPLATPAAAEGIDLIRLVAPTTPDWRMPKVLAGASGFVYAVSITGVTGTALAVEEQVAALVARIRRHTDLPVAVGFGINTPAQAAGIARIADGVVVGSAIVRRVEHAIGPDGRALPDAAERVAGFVAELAAGVRSAERGGRVMNWLTNFVPPRIRALVRKADVPDNLWHKCPACGQMIFHRELEANLHVCHHCGHHLRIGARRRFAMLFDDATYHEIELPKTAADPLKFRDVKRYTDRLREAQGRHQADDAIKVAHGRLGGSNAVVACFEFDFMGGSMGVAVGEGLVAAARLAVLQQAPLVVVPASGGARMQEGILSLMQMARTTIAIEEVKAARLPYIVVLADPTTGGVTASFAMLGDITVAEPGAVIGFAGARVIEETIREKLPEGFQRAEYLLEHGMVDMVVPRRELRQTLIRILDLLHRRQPPAEVLPPQPVLVGQDPASAALPPADIRPPER